METRNWTIEYFGMKYNMNRGSGVSRAPYYITPDIGGERWSLRSRFPIVLWMVNRERNEMLIHKKISRLIWWVFAVNFLNLQSEVIFIANGE